MDRATAAGVAAVEAIAARENLAGVYGPLYALFTVDERYKAAVEAAAGGALFHVVVDTDATAARLLEQLQREKAGRVTFMPLNRLRPPDTVFPQAPDAVVLLRKLTFDAALLPAFKQVFGKTIVCPRLDVAAAYVRSHAGLNALTLDGDQVSRRGALSGGYHDPRRSRLDAVRAVQRWRRDVDAGAAALGAHRAQLGALEQRVTQLVGTMAALESERDQLQHARAPEADELAWLRRAEADAAARRAKLAQALADRDVEAAALAQRREALAGEMGTPLVDALSDKERAELAALVAREGDGRRAVAELTRAMVSAAEAAAATRSELDEGVRRAYEAVAARLERLDTEPGDAEAAARALAAAREANAAALAATEARADALTAEIGACEARLDAARGDADAAADTERQHSTAERFSARRQRLLAQREQCNARIRDLGVLPENAYARHAALSTEQIAARLQRARAALDEVSHVNKRAVEQFHSFTKQRDALLQRHADLEASATSIRELVDVLDARKDEALSTTLAQVHEHFGAVFARLVPGGTGRLELVRGEADEPVGIALAVTFSAAQEPLRIAQLSGGQKALVALALVFAVQRCDPAPFYLFDEIDANLDTQYRTAVANMIHERARDAQFIATTFRPELVERADRCFGVLFSAAKVSSVVPITRGEAREFVEAAAV